MISCAEHAITNGDILSVVNSFLVIGSLIIALCVAVLGAMVTYYLYRQSRAFDQTAKEVINRLAKDKKFINTFASALYNNPDFIRYFEKNILNGVNSDGLEKSTKGVVDDI